MMHEIMNLKFTGYLIPTFLDNLSGPIFRGQVLKLGPLGCPETSIRIHHYSVRNDPEERSS